ncbi:OTU domain containin protein [Planoprotostelium fungivorum]|uniref:OTU domain containin protein n=1 Tax=Planoprotostelium fungivorum TaxID=1890364 RepID=A0A2P6P0I1_9EUKA|nr:OTU domain containin protein [Planoprotostelium fungivorum]
MTNNNRLITMGKKKKGGPLRIIEEEVQEEKEEEIVSNNTTEVKSQESDDADNSDHGSENEDDDDEPTETKGKMQQRHKREIQELKKKTASMSCAVSKTDKKGKKDVQDAIKKLEDELAKRHQKEVEDFGKKESKREESGPTEEERLALERLKIKRDKNIKKKAAKVEQEAEMERQIAEEKRNMGATKKDVENEKMQRKLISKKLRVHPIAPDGNCLYAAITHQLQSLGDSVPKEHHKELRLMAADYMKKNSDDFRPFLEGPNGDMMTEEQFNEFCQRTANTSCWGGQLELKALSHTLERPIIIYVAEENTPDIKMGDQFQGQPIQITFHQHAYGLGQHYNSVTPVVNEE